MLPLDPRANLMLPLLFHLFVVCCWCIIIYHYYHYHYFYLFNHDGALCRLCIVLVNGRPRVLLLDPWANLLLPLLFNVIVGRWFVSLFRAFCLISRLLFFGFDGLSERSGAPEAGSA